MPRRCSALTLSLLLASAAVAQEGPLVAPTDPRSPADERKAFKLPPGFDAQLVASDPDIMKPMQIAFDLKGRLWVPTSQEYPFPAVGRPGRDKLYVLDDFGPDGKASKVSVFADDLNIPIGILPLPDGKSVLVSSIDPGPAGSDKPAGCWIWKLTDTDGDGKADHREKLYGPFGTRDTHGTVNSFTLMPDGWVYACHGYLNEDRVKGRDGHEVHMQSGNVFRFRPDGRRIEVFTRGQVNPFGMAFDAFFNLYTADCHSKPISQLIRGAVYESFGKPHDGLGFGPNMINHDHGSTALCGLTWYEADQFPPDYKGTMFLGNVVTNRINFDKIEFVGSTPKAVQKPDFLVSSDFWFRPVDIKLGPDGCLYVSDFYNRIIGHYEVDLKHPGRDKTRGRIWRIVWAGEDGKTPRPKAVGDLTKMKPEELDKLLGHSNIMVRMWATHALINLPEEKGKEDLQKRTGDEAEARHQAHKLWVDEAEPLDGRRIKEVKDVMDSAREPDLLTAHRYRIKTAKAEWAREHAEREILKEARDREIGGRPQVERAIADWMTAEPKAQNLDEIIARLAHARSEDTHLRHAIRIALRETLRDPDAWTLLKGMQLDDQTVRLVADVMPGLPTKDAADFLTTHLALLATDTGRLPAYVEHASRHGDAHKAVFEFVTRHKPDDLRRTLGLFRAYQRGLEQRGGVRYDDADYAVAEKLVARGLADANGQANQASLEIAAGMRLKGSADAVAALAMRKDRNENQRLAAFVSLAAIDPDRAMALAGKVLADPDEPVAAREKTAQILGGIGTPAAYAQLLAALERAPARLQATIAAALAAKPEGADQLLKAIAAGKASGRLLQDRAVQTRVVESKLPKASERIAELTKGLPSADQRMTELMNQRRAGFAKAKADPKLGAAVFKTNCATCHQLGGEGAKVGPQLDGLGVRGLDRLLEDILDPSRNVDQAMRTTLLTLKDGRSVSGLLLREEGQVYVMADQQGKEVRVAKDDVDDRRTSLLSPMPANLAETIKEEDFYHLMAFLLQQRAKP